MRDLQHPNKPGRSYVAFVPNLRLKSYILEFKLNLKPILPLIKEFKYKIMHAGGFEYFTFLLFILLSSFAKKAIQYRLFTP